VQLDLRRCSTRARSSSTGSEPTLWVPKTTSTHGALVVMRPWSFCARQPPTGDLHAGRAVLDRLEVAEVAVEAVVGVLADAQVLKTTTSGVLPSCAGT
jgi:hypothetical protein